ncbi:MAG: DUF2520 domain-containing protein [Deltaproteobacteria bacterium]|nr:DUF2520 domain-containing protein [Deltaproteobacteria bacterium]
MDTLEAEKNTVAILGLGKVGTACGYLLKAAGYPVVAVASRSQTSLNQGIAYTGGEPFTRFSEAAMRAECIFITTSDDAIMSICEEISKKGCLRPGKKVIHMSGAGGLDLLEAARTSGANVASIHPLQSFADVEAAIRNIPGSTFGITAQEEIRNWSIRIVRDMGGNPFFVSEEDKPLYHTAACMASNYLTTLIHTVEQIYQSLGLSHDEAIHAFWPLIRGTLRNIEQKGTASALTGPVARGDMSTIRKHMEALHDKLPVYLEAYCAMGILAADLGLEKKTLSEEQAETIKKTLRGGSVNE